MLLVWGQRVQQAFTVSSNIQMFYSFQNIVYIVNLDFDLIQGQIGQNYQLAAILNLLEVFNKYPH